MAMDNNTGDPYTNRNHDDDEIYESIGKYESMSTEIFPPAVTPQREIAEPSKKEMEKKKRKETKQERKEHCKEQAKLEKELVKEGKIAPRYRYVPRNPFWRIVSVCLAFVLGFFAAFGALIGGLAIFGGKKKIKDAAQIAGIDTSAIFSDYAADLSTLDFVVEIVRKIKDKEFKTLGDVAFYTPYVDKLADQVITQLKNAEVEAEKAELMALPLSNLGKWFQEKVTAAYGGDYLDTHTLGDVLTINESSPIILQSLKDTVLSQLGEKTKTLTLSDMLGEKDLNSNKILRNLKESTLDSLSEDVKTLSVEQVFGDEMYSYLSIEKCGGTYQDLVRDYGENRKTDTGSWKVPVALELSDGEEIVTEVEGETVKYYLYRDGEEADELDRYLCGVWYLICGDEQDTSIRIIDINSKLTKAVDEMNGMYLWKLWLHDLIDQNPFKVLPVEYETEEFTYTNLNEFTITGLIKYVQEVLLNTP